MKITIGRIDKADFPELLLNDIALKVDTGAYTSSIHCHEITECLINGINHIKFKLLDPSHPNYNEKEFVLKNFNRKRIKNSFGTSEYRYLIKTLIIIFNHSYEIELSLSERSEMKYPILIGRKLLNGKFVVDTTKSNISYKQKIKSSQ
jgi:hypothetical protein